MLVPVQGGVANLQKRNRTIHEQTAALATVELPQIYLFNVGPRPWRGAGGGREWIVPAKAAGERYSEPLAMPTLVLSERDLADGGNNMDTVMDAALSGSRKIGNETKHIMGVADDVIGKNSTSPGLDMNTTNGEWWGVFISRSEVPEDEEVEAAEEKLREMAHLIYQNGADKVQAGEKVVMADRKQYNWAAQHLGLKSLWGNLDHTLAECPECGEDIREGAKFCKHCQQAIDPASVAGRRKKREMAAQDLLGEVSTEDSAPAQKPATAKGKAKAGKEKKQPEFGE